MNWPRPRGLHLSTIARLMRPGAAADLSTRLRVFICFADHYEPKFADAGLQVQRERVDRWVREYPESVKALADCRGRSPQHTFFYPAEEYEPEHLDRLAELCHAGHGEVEIHLHHDRDTSDRLRQTLIEFKETLFDRHGLLAKNSAGEITYGFIHGNWALDNSRADGRWCGVNDELSVLRETGCYADFTMPSAPADCQTRTINSIYYAVDDPQRPKSHDRGIAAQVGGQPPADGLMMIKGPQALNWGGRKFGFLPRLEHGDLHGGRPPTLARLRLWLQAGVGIVGRPDWRFIKLHTHGAQERNASMLLGEPMRRFHESLADFARRNRGSQYYYVTAREMAALVGQAEGGFLEPHFDGVGGGLISK